MTPGQEIDRLATDVLRVTGKLVTMIIKKKLHKSTLTEIADQFEVATATIRRIVNEQ